MQRLTAWDHVGDITPTPGPTVPVGEGRWLVTALITDVSVSPKGGTLDDPPFRYEVRITVSDDEGATGVLQLEQEQAVLMIQQAGVRGAQHLKGHKVWLERDAKRADFVGYCKVDDA